MTPLANISIAELRRRKMAVERVLHIRDAEKNLLPYVQFTMPKTRFINDSSKSVYEVSRHHEVIALGLEGLDNGTYNNLIIIVPPRHGKQISVDTPVLTTKGWKAHGDLQPGDFVFHPSGFPVRVVAVSNPAPQDCVVETTDGALIHCHENHEWTVFHRGPNEWVTMETKDFMRTTTRGPTAGQPLQLWGGERGKRGGRARYQLPPVSALQMPDAELPLDPYVLGAWLGDGKSAGATLCWADQDEIVAEAVGETNPFSSRWRHPTTGVNYGVFSGASDPLRKMGLYNNKHIPAQYLVASERQRSDLMAGLIDTDGSVEPGTRRVRIATCSDRLARDIEILIRTLGWRANRYTQGPALSTSGIQGKKDVHYVSFTPDRDTIPTRITRKTIDRTRPAPRKIGVSRVYRGAGTTGNCIQVSSNDGLYLVGEHLTPTHNSELSSRKFIPWFCGRNPGKSIIFSTYNDDVAQDFGSDVLDVLDSPQHAQVFPKLYARPGQKAKDHIGLSTGGDIFFVGRGGSLTSRGGHGLVLDDPFKDDAEAGSKLMRDKAWSWFNKTFLTRRMEDDSWVIIIATRWHEDDIIGRVTDPKNEWYSERQAKQWHIIDLPALAIDADDPLGRRPGESLWPERFNRRFLLDSREADAQGFQSLYQGRPAPEDGLFFLAQDLKTYSRGDRPPNDEMTIYMAVDYAVATEQHNDRTAILVVGVDSHGRIWVFEDSFIGRVQSDRAVEITIGLIKKFKPQFLWGEKGQISKSLGPFLRARMREENAYTTLVDLTSARDKKVKAQGIKGRSSQGLLRLPKYAAWTGEIMEELLSFPKGRHDDFVDALSFIGLGLDIVAPGRGPAPANDIEKPGTFGEMIARSNEMRRAANGRKRYW